MAVRSTLCTVTAADVLSESTLYVLRLMLWEIVRVYKIPWVSLLESPFVWIWY